jgi:hypothetical protein
LKHISRKKNSLKITKKILRLFLDKKLQKNSLLQLFKYFIKIKKLKSQKLKSMFYKKNTLLAKKKSKFLRGLKLGKGEFK